MKTIALVLTLAAGMMGMVAPVYAASARPGAHVLRLAGWSCWNWDSNGVNYTMCCRDRDGYCTGIYAG